MPQQPLGTYASATLDANGRGSVAIGPITPGVVWLITRLTTFGVTAPEPRLRVYRNIESNGTLLDTTQRGNSDVSETDVRLDTGERIVFVWENGVPGSVMTARLEGDVTNRWEE